jgi:hypothetical protein
MTGNGMLSLKSCKPTMRLTDALMWTRCVCGHHGSGTIRSSHVLAFWFVTQIVKRNLPLKGWNQKQRYLRRKELLSKDKTER